jgi:uncharacterized OB-fold protein
VSVAAERAEPSTAPVPLPVADDVTAPFWEGCRRHQLLIQRCAACGRARFHPRELCPRCRASACEWVPASGRGTVYSRVVCHAPVLPAFQDRVPYAVVLVELAEDSSLRLVGNVLDCDPHEVRIGDAVEVCFQDVGDGVTLPQWRLAKRTR